EHLPRGDDRPPAGVLPRVRGLRGAVGRGAARRVRHLRAADAPHPRVRVGRTRDDRRGRDRVGARPRDRSCPPRRRAPAGAAPKRRYGVQNSWVQALADLGVVGFAAWVAVFASAAWRAARGALAGSAASLYALLLLAALVWLWAAQGYVAGIPLDALTFGAI